MISLSSNAKVNLGLWVLPKRQDGYHDLQTIFLPVYNYADTLEIKELSGSSDISLTLNNYSVQEPIHENLIYKAYDLLRPHSPKRVDVTLTKRIPLGAGLGGGSSNAAFALRHFARGCENPPSEKELFEMALRLGSDVPFFLRNKPAIGEGRGELLKAVDLPLNGLHIAIITPPLHISTKEAFAGVKPQQEPLDLTALSKTPPLRWQETFINAFWPSLRAQHPLLNAVAERLKESGAFFVSLSGTGPSLYGLYTQKPALQQADFGNCVFHVSELQCASQVE